VACDNAIRRTGSSHEIARTPRERAAATANPRNDHRSSLDETPEMELGRR
jgi:hypothetical protein